MNLKMSDTLQAIVVPKKNNKLGIRGVTFDRGKYQATLMFRGKRHVLGRFDTPEEAKEIYTLARRDFLEFAKMQEEGRV